MMPWTRATRKLWKAVEALVAHYNVVAGTVNVHREMLLDHHKRLGELERAMGTVLRDEKVG